MIRVIIFDYDGVLSDSFADVHYVYRIMGRELGVAIPETIEEFRTAYGADYHVCYSNLGLTEDQKRAASGIFMREIRMREPALFPGIPGVIREAARKYRLSVVSLNFEEDIRRKLDAHRILPFFDHVVGQRQEEQHIRKSDEFRRVMELSGVGPDEVIAVGDMTGDWEAAEEAGIGNVIMAGYGWGFDRKRIPPDVPVIETPAEILENIQKIAG